jgi:molecular chaperone DnaK
MGNIVGIDLGTSNSVAAFKLADVEIVTAPDNTAPDRKLTRSIVTIQDGRLVVGEAAYRQLNAAPENTISSIKRLMGRGFNDAVVQNQLQHFSYKVTASSEGTDNSLAVWLDGKEYTPEDISAAILRQVLDNAEAFQSQTGQNSRITGAVITIPAYFNDKQRHATLTAAQQAKLTTIELLPEPTAAAISYGFKPDSDDVNTILVYDFGGGTFDASLITTAGNQFIELGKAGDLWLGGDDVDSRLVNLIKQKVALAEGLTDIDGLIAKMPHYQRVRFLQDLKLAAERAKIDLSQATSALVQPATPLIDELGMAISIDVTVARTEFEALILPLIDRTLEICQDAIKYSDYPQETIDTILLVGGSAQIPLVQARVKSVFGADRVLVHPRPMYAVAEGAAIVAAGLTEKVSTVSRNYCIELEHDPRFVLVKQGEILPLIKTHTLRTVGDGQRLIHFKFFSPDDVRTQRETPGQKQQYDELIGEMWLVLNSAYPKDTEVLLTIELDEQHNSIQITAILKNDPSVRESCSFSRGGIDEKISHQVAAQLQELKQLDLTTFGVAEANRLVGDIMKSVNQIKDGNVAQRQDRLEEAQSKLRELEVFASKDLTTASFLLSDFQLVIGNCSQHLHDRQVPIVEALIDRLQSILTTQNIAAIESCLAEGTRERDNLPDLIKMVLYCRIGVARAELIEPTHARSMRTKFDRLLVAMKYKDLTEIDRLIEELLPDVHTYANQETTTAQINTGIK